MMCTSKTETRGNCYSHNQVNPPCEDPFLSYAGDSWSIRAHKVQGNTKNQPVWEALE